MQRIASLDGLRAVSISLVVSAHLAGAGLAPGFLKLYASLGVRVFFVISGYLITSILLNERDRTGSINLRKFYVRRAYRIFPAALFYMLIIFAVYWRTLRWYEMAASVLYLVNYVPRHWVIGHLWSLGVEEQFYLLWPGVLQKWYGHRLAILTGAVVCSPFCIAAFTYFKWLRRTEMVPLPSVADNLAVGCLAAVFATRWPNISRPIFAVFVLLVIAIPVFQGTSAPRTFFQIFFLYPTLAAAIGGILIHVVQHPYRILNIAPVVWLGQISYSLYLWQQPFVNPASSSRFGILVGIGMACCSYYLIERPILKYRDGRVPAPLETHTERAAA